MARQSKGFCKYCGKEYTRSGMSRHIITCSERKQALEAETGKRVCGFCQLLLYGRFNGDYWLLIEMRDTATLQDLDAFIRDIWVECCGHLSAFDIYGEQYESDSEMDMMWGEPAKSMKCKLKDILSEGLVMGYDYDFGSTTELVIKVLGYRTGIWKKDAVTILSRNQPPRFICSKCGSNPAEWMTPWGYYEEEEFLCESCLEEEEDEDDEGYYLPVCNSPRMGVCGYEGSERYPDEFVPDKKIAKK